MEITPNEIRAKWLEALRSEKYKKIEGLYIRNNCYCTMGLGAKIVSELSGREFWDSLEILLETFKIKATDDGNTWGTITNKNDGLQGERIHTFAEMADVIEELIPEGK